MTNTSDVGTPPVDPCPNSAAVDATLDAAEVFPGLGFSANELAHTMAASSEPEGVAGDDHSVVVDLKTTATPVADAVQIVTYMNADCPSGQHMLLEMRLTTAGTIEGFVAEGQTTVLLDANGLEGANITIRERLEGGTAWAEDGLKGYLASLPELVLATGPDASWEWFRIGLSPSVGETWTDVQREGGVVSVATEAEEIQSLSDVVRYAVIMDAATPPSTP